MSTMYMHGIKWEKRNVTDCVDCRKISSIHHHASKLVMGELKEVNSI